MVNNMAVSLFRSSHVPRTREGCLLLSTQYSMLQWRTRVCAFENIRIGHQLFIRALKPRELGREMSGPQQARRLVARLGFRSSGSSRGTWVGRVGGRSASPAAPGSRFLSFVC